MKKMTLRKAINTIFLLLIFIIIGLALAMIIPKLIHTIPVDDYEKLKQQNDSLLLVNKEIDKTLNLLQFKADSIKRAISVQKNKIVYLKQKKDEKIYIVNTFSNNDLYNFFAGINTTDSISRN